MAIQKHNIYYDASKPESGIYYYAENGEQKELFLNNVLSGENGISAISAIDGNTWVIGITDDYKDNIEKIPGLSDNFVILSADVGNKLYVSATDNWDILPYSGSTNISIHDHIIDFQNTANLIGDDAHIAVISADNNIIVSALKDFVDKEYVDEAIVSSVSGKFDSSAFNTYSGIIDNKIDKLSNDFNNKLDISATNNWDISAYIAGNHISIEDHIISIEDAKNLSGDEKNITVLETDDAFVISGLKDFVDKKYVDDAIASAAPTSAVANKLDKSVFSAYSADIALQLNNISADKLDTSAFTAYSAHALDDYYKKTETYNKQEIQNALDEKQDNLTNEQLSAISSVSAIQSISANWLTEEDIEDFITEDEVESVSSTLTAQTNYLSGIIDTKLDTTVFDTYTATALDDYYTKDETKGLINGLSSTVSSQLNNKLDTTAFAAYSGNINNQINTVSSEVDKKLYTSATNDWDVTPYSGINGIKVENHLISVSANYALSADVYSKSQIDDIIANFGGFQIVSEDAQGKPDVSDPSTKIIYLTLVDDDPAAFDKYREWIWTNSEWECIGIASIDLKDYAKTQDVIASANATSAWINNTFYDKTETSGKTEIQNALDTKLDTTAFNDYSDNIDEQLQTLSSVKLDISAFTAYSDDIESQLDTLNAIKLDKTYSATVNEQLSAKLDTSAFTAYSAEINTELNNITADVDKKLYTSATDNWDYVAYSGGQNVSVVNHVIDISGTKSLSGDEKNIEVVELADTFIISATKDIVDKSYVDNNFVSKTDFGTYSGNTKNQIDSKLDISAFTAYSAHALDDYYKKSDTSGKQEIQDALDEKQDNLTNEQLSAISSVSAIQSNTENWNAAYDTLTAYSADGKWLIADDITALATKNEVEIASGVLTAQTNYLSGIIDTKLDTTAFDTYTATALDNYYNIQETDNLIDDLSATVDNRLTNKLDTSAFTAYSADVKTQIDSKLNKTDFDDYSAHALADYYTKNETDAKITDAINDISATVSTDYLKKADVQEYTAGNNIDITNYVISGRDWTPELNTKVNNIDFTAYSADVKTQIDSKLNKSDFDDYSAHADTTPYSGINGIKVENHLISVSANYALSADVYSKSEVNDIRDAIAKELAGLGFYDCKSDEIKANGEPDETVLETRELLSNNKIYLVKDNTAPVPDQYKEWIWDGTNWTCIGDTSISLVAYAKTQDVIASAIATSAWINDTFYDKRETSGKQQIQDALNTKLNTSIFTAYSASTKTQIDSKLNKSDFDNYSANALNDYYKKSETSGKTEIQNALNTKLDTTAFNDYTATALNNYYTKDETSGKTEIQNALNTKLDTTAFNDYTATALNDIASNSGNWNASYTALTANSGNWDNTYNTVTTNSGKWENSYTALTANSALWLKEADVAGFATKTELNNASSILINQDNYLSGVIDTKLDTTAFNAYSAHALDEYYKRSETSGKTEIQNALGTKLDTTAFNGYSANIKTQIDSKLTKNDFDSYSAIIDTNIDYISAAVSSIPAQVQSDWEETDTTSPAYIQNKPVDLEMSAGDGISITETNNTLVFAVSGNYADATEVNNKLTALSANKLDISATTGWDISAYSAGNNITIVDHVIDLKESKNLIGDGENIIVTESGNNIIVSALKDILDKDDFDSYSAIIDDDIDYLSAAIEDSILSVGTDLKIENGIISLNTNGIVENSADMSFVAGSATYASGIGAAAFGYASSAVNDYAFAAGYRAQAIGDGSHAEGIGTKAIGVFSHAEGNNTSATNNAAHAEGEQTLAGGFYTHSEGGYTVTQGNYTHAEGYYTSALLFSTHAEGWGSIANGNASHAEGNRTIANASYSHAEGESSSANAMATHAEGSNTLANSTFAHAEGGYTTANGYASHAEGYYTNAVDYSHAEGKYTSSNGAGAHAEGVSSLASGYATHVEGVKTTAIGETSHAEGSATLASGKCSHAEGGKTSAIGTYTHAEGVDTKAAGEESHAEGWGTVASGHNSHAEGWGTVASGHNSHAEGNYTTAAGLNSHAEGYKTSAMGQYTHTEGQNTIANNDCAHAEGQNTSALKMMTHAEGQYTIADKNCAHAEGFYTKSSGEASHTEGQFTSATMDASHAEGGWTIANANYAHAEGHCTSAIGYASHAEGDFTIAGTYNMHAGGIYNKTSADALFVIGNGNAETARSDAFIITNAGLASATILATSGIPDIEAAITSIPSQVQTDWEETNTASPAYIQNKPDDLEMSAGNGISITEVNDTLVFAVSGNYADATEVDTYYGKKTNDVYYIKPDLPYDLYSSTATYNVGDKVVLTAGSGSLYSAKSAVTTPGAWSTNSGKFAGVSNVVFTAENEDITELYDGLKIALYLPSRLASADSYLNINGLGDVELYKNNNIKLTSGYFPTSGVVIYFTYVSATNRWVWADYDSNSTYAGMVDAYVNLSASATNISAACTNFSAKPGNTINVSFARDYTAVSAKKFRAGTTTYQPLYLNGSATSNTNYFIPSGTWPVYYDGDNWYLWTDGSIQFSAIRGTVIDCVKYNDIQYAIGTANTAIGSTTARYSVALGISNSAYNSFVIGNYNKGNESHIFGNSNSGINSYIVGYNCTGNESYLFGKDLSGKSWGIELGDFGDTCYPVIVGNKNATHTSAYFVVGCGNTLGNADAFIVSSNKVASAADFLAGNGVSLSSLTGLATSSWVNGQIADAITSIPAQVQSDWSATNTASPAYIQNKPDVLIPVDSPAALGGISKPTNIMVVSAMPASPDSATIYLVQGTMIGN